jgi:crossover junction endodeoxyribonuclease RuvC
MTRVLSWDVGYSTGGFSVVDFNSEGQLDLLYCENIITKSKGFTDKLVEYSLHFEQLLNKYSPSVFVYEEPIMKGQVGAKLNQVIGVMRCLAKKRNLIEKSYTPTEMKKIVTGKGTAEKEDIIAAVEKVFTERKFIDKENHAADSLGLSLCYVYEISKP